MEMCIRDRLNIPQDALSFSVYDIEQEEYLFYEGDSQLPTPKPPKMKL